METVNPPRRTSVSVIASTTPQDEPPLVGSAEDLYATLLKKQSLTPVFPAPAFARRVSTKDIALLPFPSSPTSKPLQSPTTQSALVDGIFKNANVSVFEASADEQARIAEEKRSVYRVKSDAKVVSRDAYSATKGIKPAGDTLPRNASASLSRSTSSKSMSSRELGLRRIEKTWLLATRKPDAFVVNECRLLSGLSGHPHIVTLVDFWCEADAFVQIIHPCPNGGTLADVCSPITRNALTEKQAANVVAQLASALYFIHSIGIAHCNILASNVQLRDLWSDVSDNALALAGFGYAAALTRLESAQSTIEAFQTESAIVQDAVFAGPAGSVNCLTPEQIPSSPWPKTAKIDSFQLGILLYQLLSGQIHPFIPPASPLPVDLDAATFAPQTVLQVVTRIAKGEHFPMSGPRFMHLTPECTSLVSMLLSTDPDKRPTAKQVLEGEWLQQYVRKHDLQYYLEVSSRKANVVLDSLFSRDCSELGSEARATTGATSGATDGALGQQKTFPA